MSITDAGPVDLPRPVGYELKNGLSERSASVDHSHNIEVEDWKFLSDIYENGWEDYDPDGTAIPEPVERGKYLLLPTGFVICQGTITGGDTTPGTTLWTFPVGYRPKLQVVTVGVGGVGFCRIDVTRSGAVNGIVGLDIDNTSFFLYYEADRDRYAQFRS